jgi:hypothetical protein
VHLGPFEVEALVIPHDAPHVALRVSAAGGSGSRRTWHATREPRVLQGCDLVMLEANHCPAMLEAGPYPGSAPGGGPGHPTNQQAAELAAR